MNVERIKIGVQRLRPWFHNLHLPGGIQTASDHPLGDFPRFKWARLEPHLPPNLKGWKVLDLGCNAGFYSFELARRGADVLGIDADRHYLSQARWAQQIYGIHGNLRFARGNIYDLINYQQSFDLVLFMGLFYHLRYPLLALDLVARITKRKMIFQSLSLPGKKVEKVEPNYELKDRHALLSNGWPRMAFIEQSLAGDPTNWWIPNRAAVLALSRSAGFQISHELGHEIYVFNRQRRRSDPHQSFDIKCLLRLLRERKREMESNYDRPIG